MGASMGDDEVLWVTDQRGKPLFSEVFEDKENECWSVASYNSDEEYEEESYDTKDKAIREYDDYVRNYKRKRVTLVFPVPEVQGQNELPFKMDLGDWLLNG